MVKLRIFQELARPFSYVTYEDSASSYKRSLEKILDYSGGFLKSGKVELDDMATTNPCLDFKKKRL